MHERRFDAKKRPLLGISKQRALYAASGVASGTLALQSRRFDAKKRLLLGISEQRAPYAASGVASGTLALQSILTSLARSLS